jgi:hypothetical protein
VKRLGLCKKACEVRGDSKVDKQQPPYDRDQQKSKRRWHGDDKLLGCDAPAVRMLGLCEKACEVRDESKMNNNHPINATSNCLSAGGMGTTNCLAVMLLL